MPISLESYSRYLNFNSLLPHSECRAILCILHNFFCWIRYHCTVNSVESHNFHFSIAGEKCAGRLHEAESKIEINKQCLWTSCSYLLAHTKPFICCFPVIFICKMCTRKYYNSYRCTQTNWGKNSNRMDFLSLKLIFNWKYLFQSYSIYSIFILFIYAILFCFLYILRKNGRLLYHT